MSKMPAKLRFTLKHNGNILYELEEDTSTQPSELVKCLSEFQQMTNSKLTGVVEATGRDAVDVDQEDSSSDEGEDVQSNPKKRKS